MRPSVDSRDPRDVRRRRLPSFERIPLIERIRPTVSYFERGRTESYERRPRSRSGSRRPLTPPLHSNPSLSDDTSESDEVIHLPERHLQIRRQQSRVHEFPTLDRRCNEKTKANGRSQNRTIQRDYLEDLIRNTNLVILFGAVGKSFLITSRRQKSSFQVSS